MFVAGFLMMQVMMLATPSYVATGGDLAPDLRQLLNWGSWVLSIPVVWFAGLPFLSFYGNYAIHGPIDNYRAPNGGNLRRALRMPDYRDYAAKLGLSLMTGGGGHLLARGALGPAFDGLGGAVAVAGGEDAVVGGERDAVEAGAGR